MHHIFFPPGLQVVLGKDEPDRLGANLLHHLLLHGVFRDEFECPAFRTVGRVGTGESNDTLFVLFVDFTRPPGALRINERALDAFRAVTLPYVRNVPCGAVEVLCDFRILQAIVGVQENVRTLNDAGGANTPADDVTKERLLVLREVNGVELLHGTPYIIGMNFLEEVLVSLLQAGLLCGTLPSMSINQMARRAYALLCEELPAAADPHALIDQTLAYAESELRPRDYDEFEGRLVDLLQENPATYRIVATYAEWLDEELLRICHEPGRDGMSHGDLGYDRT